MTRSILAPLPDRDLTRAEKDAIVFAANGLRADLDRAEATILRLQAALREAEATIAEQAAEMSGGLEIADAAECEAREWLETAA